MSKSWPLDRTDIERREKEILAPYAAKAVESKGRVYPQKEHRFRTAYQRDRDRIIHSTAFRRLEYKTQVFIPHERDHFRTRLTHTIEVAQISRTLARSLGLNEDLAEAIALVHDLGHTPYGHSGEDVLDELLRDHGGFNHNRQSLKIVDLLEQRYPDHPGLNLSYEVREGIARHETTVRIDLPEFPLDIKPTLEASLVDIADEIAYNAHDIDDGISSGLLTFDVIKNDSVWDAISDDKIRATVQADVGQARYMLVRHLVNLFASDVIEYTRERLRQHQLGSVDDVRKLKENLVGYSPALKTVASTLKQFLRKNLYKHSALVDLSKSASETIQVLYKHFLTHQDCLPDRYQSMLDNEKAEIVVADYIAGMTDRYADMLVVGIRS